MTTAAAPSHRWPRRRSVLLGSALLGSFALASCEDATPDEANPSQRVPVTLEFEQMVTDAELWPEDRTRVGAWAISPGPDRPMSLLLHFDDQLTGTLDVVTLEKALSSKVDLPPSAVGVLVDGHADRVRVVTWSVADGHYKHLAMTSADLETWEQTPLSEGIDCSLDAAGGGLVVSGDMDGEVRAWDVADDGTVTALPALEVPEGQEWGVEGIQRSGSTIVLLVTVREGTRQRVPMTVTSTDDGATWAEPSPLRVEGASPVAGELLPVGEGFLVVRSQEEMSTVAPGRRTARPTAWSSEDGLSFEQESIPVPAWGLEGFMSGETELAPDTPIDWIEVGRGRAVLSPARDQVHLMVHTRDDPRTAIRSAEGTWTTSALGGTTMQPVLGGVSDPSGWVVYSDIWVHGRQAEMQQGPEVIYNVSFAKPRHLRAGHRVMGQGTSALLLITEGVSVRTDEQVAGARFQRTTGMSILGLEITSSPDLPDEVSVHTGAVLDQAGEELTFLTGEGFDLDELSATKSLVWASADGIAWEASSGLPEEAAIEVVPPTVVEGTYYLPTAQWEDTDRGRSHLRATVYSSPDGLSWEAASENDPQATDVGAGTAAIETIAGVNGSVIGLGFVRDEDDIRRAATFTLVDGTLEMHPVVDAGAGSLLSTQATVGGEVHAALHGSSNRYIQVRIAEDGSADEIYRSTCREQRQLSLDLGNGALIATGWIEQPGTAIGACLWASRDGGDNWDATVIPLHEGRFPDLSLLRDGEDVVVLADDPDGPRGYRLVDARAAVLGERSPSDGGGEASDGGS